MAMKSKITVDQARSLAANIRKGVTQFGSQYSPAYSKLEMAEAILVLAEAANADGPTKEEHTKLARQLAACTSREKGLRNRIAGVNNEDEASELKEDVAKPAQTGS